MTQSFITSAKQPYYIYCCQVYADALEMTINTAGITMVGLEMSRWSDTK